MSIVFQFWGDTWKLGLMWWELHQNLFTWAVGCFRSTFWWISWRPLAILIPSNSSTIFFHGIFTRFSKPSPYKPRYKAIDHSFQLKFLSSTSKKSLGSTRSRYVNAGCKINFSRFLKCSNSHAGVSFLSMCCLFFVVALALCEQWDSPKVSTERIDKIKAENFEFVKLNYTILK